MLKKDITFVDFRGETKTVPYYFNISNRELTEVESKTYLGIQNKIINMANAKSVPESADMYKKFILFAYGEPSDDGIHFIKHKDGHALAEDFEQSAAFDALYMELGSDPDKALEFVAGVLPKDYREDINKVRSQLQAMKAKGLTDEEMAKQLETTVDTVAAKASESNSQA